jgi:L-cystine uptake protein TcyP (sodium:dicarboxylate symporter family)
MIKVTNIVALLIAPMLAKNELDLTYKIIIFAVIVVAIIIYALISGQKAKN